MLGIGVIGAGYWGPKHVRNFNELPGARTTIVADLDEQRLNTIQQQFPGTRTTTNYRHVLESADVDAVVVATPVSTHGRLAEEALLAGKHVLVEKPLARTSREAEDLVKVAESHGRVLMVGHTFLYNPAVTALRQLIQDGVLGDIYYINAQRLNLGLFQRDINVMWDLAPHDLSIIMHILGAEPVAVSAVGTAYVQPAIEDVAYINLAFPNRVRAAVHVSWLDPNKVRRLTVVGSRKMAVYDDVEALEKIRIYDKGVEPPAATASFGDFQLSYRYGDIMIPHIAVTEPLRLECEHFLECIRSGMQPLSDGRQGVTVVRVLEAAQASLETSLMLTILPSSASVSANGANGKHTNGTSSTASQPVSV